MSFRRLIYIAIFAVSVWIAVRTRVPATMIDPVIFCLAVMMAFVTLVAAVFDLPFGKSKSKSKHEDSGSGMLEPLDTLVAYLGSLIFAALPLITAAEGIYRGVIPSFGSGPDITFSHAPLRFLFEMFMWVAVGLGVLALMYLVH